jgi:hypothetical protein
MATKKKKYITNGKGKQANLYRLTAIDTQPDDKGEFHGRATLLVYGSGLWNTRVPITLPEDPKKFYITFESDEEAIKWFKEEFYGEKIEE